MDEWVWSNGGMILTGENCSTERKTLYSVGGRWMNEYGAMVEWYWQGKTEVLGEKHYTVWVVDEWMSMEQWWMIWTGKTKVLGNRDVSRAGISMGRQRQQRGLKGISEITKFVFMRSRNFIVLKKTKGNSINSCNCLKFVKYFRVAIVNARTCRQQTQLRHCCNCYLSCVPLCPITSVLQCQNLFLPSFSPFQYFK